MRRLCLNGHVIRAALSLSQEQLDRGGLNFSQKFLPFKCLFCVKLNKYHGRAQLCDRHVSGDSVLGACWRSSAAVHPQRTKQRVNWLASL